jgi:DnaJ homolog subfamily C member 19
MFGGAPFILVAVVVGIWALSRMGRMTPAQSRKFQRQFFGAALTLLALFFLMRGEIYLALPALAIGAGILGFAHLLPSNFQAGPAKSQSAPPRPPAVPMDKGEALSVLGLSAGASEEEIKAAHKRLQRANHPDTGGTNYLAGKINQARDVLLKS